MGNPENINKDKLYDVIVVGGDPEGIAAAVTAARNGMNTLLIEDDEALGGLMTLGGLNFIDMCTGDDGTLLTQGTFLEFHDAVGGTAFDIQKAKDKPMAAPGVKSLKNLFIRSGVITLRSPFFFDTIDLTKTKSSSSGFPLKSG